MTELNRQAKEDKVEQIVRALMGKLYTWKKPRIQKTVGPYDTSEFDNYFDAIEAIKLGLAKNLQTLSIDELNFRFDVNGFFKDGDVIKQEVKANRYFHSEIRKLTNHPPNWISGGFGNSEYIADFSYWGKMSEYTLDEALLLTVGIDPKHVGEDRLNKMANKVDAGHLYPAFEFLVRRRELFKRYFPRGRNSWFSIPQHSLKSWIDSIKLETHSGFYDELEKMYPKAKSENLQKAPKKLTNQERDTLLKLIAAMACEQYQYNPCAERSSVTSSIRDDIESVGLSMDNKTILKWLKEASTLVSKDYWDD